MRRQRPHVPVALPPESSQRSAWSPNVPTSRAGTCTRTTSVSKAPPATSAPGIGDPEPGPAMPRAWRLQDALR